MFMHTIAYIDEHTCVYTIYAILLTSYTPDQKALQQEGINDK